MMFRARVSGPFFAIMTLAMLAACYTIILDMQPFTDGVNGITPPTPFQFAGMTVDPYSPLAYWTVFVALLSHCRRQAHHAEPVRLGGAGDPRRCRAGAVPRL